MNKKTIVVASSNKGKIREIKEIFKDYEVLPIKEIEERLGRKIVVKLEIFIQVGKDYICIADDSGISINILAGFLGVHTARWMDVDDHTKILNYLKSKNTRGNNAFGFDEILELESGLTLTEIPTTEKLRQSPRRKLLDLVNKFVEKHNS